MTYAIVSDVHANLPALRAVFDRIGTEPRIMCLGDVVGYGAQPNECVALVRARADVMVLGNHDVAAVDDHGIDLFNPDARTAIAWTQTALEPEHRAWLDGLAYEHRTPRFLLVHGAPVSYFTYVLDERSARDAFAATDAPIVFVGHTHVAGAFALHPDGTLDYRAFREGGTLALEPDRRYLINVGSVGQPRDRNPDACYATFDDEAGVVEWIRVPYDVERAQRSIHDARLPEALARRLGAGR